MHVEFQQKVKEIIEKYSTKTAISYMKNNGKDETITFREIGDFIHNAEEEFEEMGLAKGDRVAIISPHSPYAVFTGMALTYSGITVVLIDAALPQEEIERLIKFSDVRAIFTISRIYDAFNGICNIPCFSLEQGLKLVPFDAEKNKCHDLSPTKDPEEDVIAILFSSGTTDQMKGIKVTYKSVLKAREVFVRLAGLEDYMKYLLVLPFNHIAGFTGAMTYFLTGCELCFIEDVNPSKLANGLLHFQPHYFAMVPKVYEVMEEKIRAKIHEKGKAVEGAINLLMKLSGFLRKHFGINIGRKLFNGIISQVFGENIFGIGTGASPCKKSTAEFYLNLGLEWSNLYATTETSVPIVATGIYDCYPADTIGNVNAHPEIQVKIGNPDENGVGEILVKSELMMKGYFRQPELTEEVFDNEYFKTGDYGFIDKKGYLHMTGRIKESIVLRTGKKVSPADVDEYYSSRLPDIELASRGITNEKEAYDEIHLFIEDKSYSLTEKENILKKIQEISRQAPGMYKQESVHFIQQIPKTTVGKVKRFSLDIPNRQEITQSKDTMIVANETTNYENKKSGSYVNSPSEQVYEIISRLNPNSVEVLDSSLSLKKDLGFDSLSLFELYVEIESATGINVTDKMQGEPTVGDIVKILDKKDRSSHVSTYDIDRFPLPKRDKDLKFIRQFQSITQMLWNFEIIGVENIPSVTKLILCPNHESYLDAMWIASALYKNNFDVKALYSLAAEHLMNRRLMKKAFVALGGIPVDRMGNTAPAIERALQCLNNDKCLMIIHPEGTRTRSGELGEFKQGAAMMSIESGVQILPVCINGAYKIFPPYRKLPRLFNWKHFRKYTLQIKFGESIDPSGKTAGEITNEIKQQIVEMKGGSEG